MENISFNMFRIFKLHEIKKRQSTKQETEVSIKTFCRKSEGNQL